MRPCPACGAAAARPFRARGGLALLACADCGSQRLDLAAHARELKGLYRDGGYFEAWDLRPGSPAWQLRAATARLRVQALEGRAPRGGRWLDVGCAGGYLVRAALDAGFDAWGVEPNPHAVAVARQVAPGRVRRGRFSAGFPRGPLDVVSLFDVLEHLDDPRPLLRLAFRRLRPGGWLALSLPDVDSLSRRLIRGAWAHYKLEHCFLPSRAALRGLLQGAGFAVVHEAPARKRLSLGLMLPLLEAYPVPGTLGAVRLARRALPRALQALPFTVSIGERFVLAQRPR